MHEKRESKRWARDPSESPNIETSWKPLQKIFATPKIDKVALHLLAAVCLHRLKHQERPTKCESYKLYTRERLHVEID
jgi:hypothetical protein